MFLFAALLVLVLAPPASAAWRMPVDGEVVRAFRHDGRAPFAAGQRRGVDIAARPGETVRAACSGRVSFAGAVPGFGRGVSVRCGRLTATHLRLRDVSAGRGSRVAAGAAIGVAAASGAVRLGARVTRERFGYVDPLGLMGSDRAPGRAPLAPPVRRRRLPLPPGVVVRAPGPAGAPVVPWPAWAGLGLLAAGIGAGGLVRARRPARFRRGWAPSTSPRRSTT